MGEIRVNVELKNHSDIVLSKQGSGRKRPIRQTTVDAMVDTGAVMVLLPEDLVEKLGLERYGKTVVALAGDRKVEMDVAGTIELKIGDRSWITDCLVGPPTCEPLIGQLVLERLDLIVDPLKRTITPRPESPLLPLLKMK